MEVVFFALIIDLVIADNLGVFHPVVLIGKFITFLEKRLYKYKSKKVAGILLVAFVVLTSFFSVFFLLELLATYKILFLIMSAFLLSTTFALKGLIQAGYKIYRALKRDDLKKARKLLQNIVGRDTDKLDKPQVIKVTIESLAENTVDSIIAPLFYAFIGGPALAIAYRSINTLDAMVGYKNQKYEQFGWAAARLDDFANYIPARLSLVFIWIASFICRLNFKQTIKVSLSDGPAHSSPNSGLSEAAFAGALGIKLGGLSYYQGIAYNLPSFGKETKQINDHLIISSLILITVTSLIFLAMLTWIMVMI